MTDRNLIAIDLAKSVFQVCVFSRTGKVVSNRRHRRAELKRFFVAWRSSDLPSARNHASARGLTHCSPGKRPKSESFE